MRFWLSVARAQLTEPYAVLLTKGLARKALNEVELIRKAAAKAESGPGEPLSDTSVSIFFKLAEGEWKGGVWFQHIVD